jgi:hypothetical protein
MPRQKNHNHTPKKPGPKRPYAQISREKLDIATEYCAKHLSHYANVTKDEGLQKIASAAGAVKKAWEQLRELAALREIKSPLKGRAVGPVVEKGDKVRLVGPEYERMTVQYGQKAASAAWTVEGAVGNWVKLSLVLDPKKPAEKLGHTATSRCITKNGQKADQAQKDIESQLQAQAGGLA